MLLFVMQPQLDQRRDPGESIGRGFINQPDHGCVDMRPVAINLLDGGTRKKASSWLRVPLADGLVIRIKQETVFGMEEAVARLIGDEQKRLEEPTGVR